MHRLGKVIVDDAWKHGIRQGLPLAFLKICAEEHSDSMLNRIAEAPDCHMAIRFVSIGKARGQLMHAWSNPVTSDRWALCSNTFALQPGEPIPCSAERSWPGNLPICVRTDTRNVAAHA